MAKESYTKPAKAAGGQCPPTPATPIRQRKQMAMPTAQPQTVPKAKK